MPVRITLEDVRFDAYDVGGFYDELFDDDGQPRPGAGLLIELLSTLPDGELERRQQAAEQALLAMGITFQVTGDAQGAERIFPFDVIPRILPAADFDKIEKGLAQRIFALNEFVDDIYHDQKIIGDGVVPEFVIRSATSYMPEVAGLDPPRRVWCHITGTDLVRDRDGTFYVLEDNLRCPSGVSYVLENRQVLKRTFPRVFAASNVRPVDDYANRLLETLQSLAPEGVASPNVVVLTPGPFNSAYFEHSFLAQQMGVELVEGLVFRADSMLGVPGLMDAYRAGRVALANAPGTGVADDKVVYAYVPEIVKYYTGEDAILPNVETFVCWEDSDRSYVLDHLEELVVKAANESGGYGMLVGPHSTADEREDFAARIEAEPRTYIAQPTVGLSRAPVIVEGQLEGRHVDLRPFVLYGEDISVLPGGLTRVALKRGSLVVNSSQGGGSKDTWVLRR
jgi:uncharacterized circularly permuted ATP-grasp superfamily protein